MKHNIYRFTLKCLVPHDIPAKEIIEDHLKNACLNMVQDVVETGDIVIARLNKHLWIVQLAVVVKDYGVPQVGVDIVSAWISEIFRHLDTFLIDAMIVHPKKDGNGALIKWDYNNNCPIVKVITTK